jgi:hypothetical protein
MAKKIPRNEQPPQPEVAPESHQQAPELPAANAAHAPHPDPIQQRPQHNAALSQLTGFLSRTADQMVQRPEYGAIAALYGTFVVVAVVTVVFLPILMRANADWTHPAFAVYITTICLCVIPGSIFAIVALGKAGKKISGGYSQFGQTHVSHGRTIAPQVGMPDETYTRKWLDLYQHFYD